jgi:hypothetical protein
MRDFIQHMERERGYQDGYWSGCFLQMFAFHVIYFVEVV